MLFWQDVPHMNLLEENTISCPYCGELITILVDQSIDSQQYIEDCEVCCRPIDISIKIDNSGACQVEIRNENE
jgi:hypothetical protein